MYKRKAAGSLNNIAKKFLSVCCLLLALWMLYAGGGKLHVMAAELPSEGAGRQEGEAREPEQGVETEGNQAPEQDPTGEGNEAPEQIPEEGDTDSREATPVTNNRVPSQGARENSVRNEPAREITPLEGEGVTPLENEEAWEGELRLLMNSRVRRIPDTESSIVGTLEEGTTVYAVGRLEDENGELWYHIKSEELAVEGYMKADLIEVIEGEGEESPSPGPLAKVKSNFILDGSGRMKIHEVIPAMAQTGEGISESPAVKGGIESFLMSIRTQIDLGAAILIVFVITAIVILFYMHSKVMAGLLPKPDAPKGKKKAKKRRHKGRKSSNTAPKMRIANGGYDGQSDK